MISTAKTDIVKAGEDRHRQRGHETTPKKTSVAVAVAVSILVIFNVFKSFFRFG
jgi:hypothetical protein